MDRKRRRGIRRGGRRAKIGVEPVAFYGNIYSRIRYSREILELGTPGVGHSKETLKLDTS